MNILFISATYLPTVNGVSYYQYHLAKALRRLKHTVYIFAPQHPRAKPNPYVIRYPAVITPIVHDYPLGIPLLNLKLLNHQPLDLVHIHHPFTIAQIALKLKRTHQLPFIFTHHTQYQQYIDTYTPGLSRLTAAYLQRHFQTLNREAFRIICPTQAIFTDLQRMGLTNTTVIANGIDLTRFKPLTSKPSAPLNLIYTGRLEKEKNPLPLIDFAAAIKPLFPNFHLTVVGSGKLLSPLKKLATQHRLNQEITFTGRLSHSAIQQLLPHQHFFVSFSTTEVMPLSYLEALACGVPLALTRPGQISGLSSTQNTLIINESPAAAAAQIISAFQQPGRFSSLTHQAIKSAQKYDINYSARQIEKLYYQATSSRSHEN